MAKKLEKTQGWKFHDMRRMRDVDRYKAHE